jgi:hypothetical protein
MVRINDISPPDFSANGKYTNYYKVIEYVVVTIVVFILAIVFWNLLAFLLAAMKKCEKIIKE